MSGLGLAWGGVTAVRERLARLTRVEVEGRPAVAYPDLAGDLEEGDIVLVNTRARELGLGSGGFDVVVANLTRGLWLDGDPDAHVMTLPYTPLQHAVRFAEEDGLDLSRLDGTPVVCTSVHSQVAPVCAGLAGVRVAYVQLGGGALPVQLSDILRALHVRQLLHRTIAVSPCFGGDLQCVSVASALLVARQRGAQAIVCSIGPGIVGTGTRFGHGGVAAAEAANAASALGGRAVIAPRVSFGDSRERHRGLSHHTRSVLELTLGGRQVAWPAGLDPPEGIEVETVPVTGWEGACAHLELSHMGRSPRDDPWFFAAAYAAGRLARTLVRRDPAGG